MTILETVLYYRTVLWNGSPVGTAGNGKWEYWEKKKSSNWSQDQDLHPWKLNHLPYSFFCLTKATDDHIKK